MPPGPIPKRTEERRRRNKVPGETSLHMADVVVPPELPARPLLHPVVIAWYESLKVSGQSRYYEPSDWAEAVINCLMLNKLVRSAKPKAEMYAQCQKRMDALLTTEPARRRMRLFITRPYGDVEEEPGENVTAIDRYKRNLEGGP